MFGYLDYLQSPIESSEKMPSDRYVPMSRSDSAESSPGCHSYNMAPRSYHDNSLSSTSSHSNGPPSIQSHGNGSHGYRPHDPDLPEISESQELPSWLHRKTGHTSIPLPPSKLLAATSRVAMEPFVAMEPRRWQAWRNREDNYSQNNHALHRLNGNTADFNNTMNGLRFHLGEENKSTWNLNNTVVNNRAFSATHDSFLDAILREDMVLHHKHISQVTPNK